MEKVFNLKVPRWGVHENIKYSPRRSLLKICPKCDKLFLQYNKGYRIYCSDICRINAHRDQKRIVNKRIRAKRDKYLHAEQERISYAQGLRSPRKWKPGIDHIPKPKLNDKGEPDWDAYHKSLSNKLRKIGIE